MQCFISFTGVAFELGYHSHMIGIQYLEISFWIFLRGEFDDEQTLLKILYDLALFFGQFEKAKTSSLLK